MQEDLQTIDVHLDSPEEALTLFGTEDRNLKQMEEQLSVTIVSRGEKVNVSGVPEHVAIVEDVIGSLLALIRKGLSVTERDIVYAIELAKKGKINQFEALYEDEITRNAKGKPIRVKTLGQRDYISAIKRNDLTFGIGPAGTGKTYLAVVMAVNALKNGDVKRIVLTRPAVEAGESLGFLPGDLKEKVDPYLRPLYDSLHDLFGVEHTARLIERGTIEIAPLAYMRGRTLDDAFALLDEAQNTTPEQMKMFLTRLGFGSKMIITGDITQVDLPKGMNSGLIEAKQKLSKVKGSSFIHLDETDVVRHPLVQRIIEAYEDKE
ncbi:MULTISPECIES: PhoH family protein [Salimicrobium]|uniref:PhoH-like protein n=4 Tax=Salimicrobium TaxID=351195 RepID=K2GDA9_9BACI|nr:MULTISPECIES: PhoH family protein [Salimicrobium]AKG04283.1 phosphate starvation-inducible protein PhoH [Salimicrobium jeotgali]EKE32252.1 PhoH protein [Salimicrobium jeotgali]MBM7695864.1 phosphate starvation-inducible PhoH-like protein [Salimicrobium jeotgali]PBB06854.1 PhoH family protein [Salimicrobium humidisoli]SDX68068.1 phosphate starvation-inducible protein PhoH [Salimicrobium album]